MTFRLRHEKETLTKSSSTISFLVSELAWKASQWMSKNQDLPNIIASSVRDTSK